MMRRRRRLDGVGEVRGRLNLMPRERFLFVGLDKKNG